MTLTLIQMLKSDLGLPAGAAIISRSSSSSSPGKKEWQLLAWLKLLRFARYVTQHIHAIEAAQSLRNATSRFAKDGFPNVPRLFHEF